MGTAAKNLKKARKMRHRMSSALRALEKGDANIEDVLRTPPDALGRCRVYDVLRRTPHLGDTKARKILERHRIWPNDRLASIPPEKRSVLIASLPDRVKAA